MKPFEAPERSVETKVFLCVKNLSQFNPSSEQEGLNWLRLNYE